MNKLTYCIIIYLAIFIDTSIIASVKLSKPSLFHKFTKSITSCSIALSLFSGSPLLIDPVYAFGPASVDLKITNYRIVELCNGQKPIMPGQKAMEGLFPICVEVEADVTNPEKSTTLTDVSVYGFVKENDAGNSVLPNNPDFRSDSGQYAMIKSVPPGTSHITYQFVAAISNDPKKSTIPTLTFFKTKAIGFPGGSKFKPLGICEIDPRAEGCDGENDD
eukprot:gene12190-16330_t